MIDFKTSVYLFFLTLMFSLAQGDVIKNKVGTTGFQFLKIGIGPREVALAGTSFTITEGPIAMYWNPAGICSNNKYNFSFFYNSWIATLDHSFVGITVPITLNDFMGVSVNFLSMDKMEETTIDEPLGTGREFSAYDFAATVSYGRRISDRFNVGISTKYITEKIWDLTANGWMLDFGFTYKTRNIILGITFANFGTDKEISGKQLETEQQLFPAYQNDEVLLSLKPQKIRLPSIFRFGAGYQFEYESMHKMLLLGDVVYNYDIGEKLDLGVEYSFMNNYMLRGGYQFNHEGFNWSFGLGIKAYIGNIELMIDYAGVNTKDFDIRHQTGLTFRL